MGVRNPPVVVLSSKIMNLVLDTAVAAGYRSASQIARVVTQQWATANLFCLACSSDRLAPLQENAAVVDYRCPSCDAAYQLKSKSGPFGRKVQNSAYEPKMRAIQRGNAPHYAFLQYSRETWRVTDLFVIPSHFFTPAVIEMRRPLTVTARRAGWVGSNILLHALAPEARLEVVSNSQVRPDAEVRSAWSRFAFLGTDQRARGGWGAAVLMSIRILQKEAGGDEFSLQDFYRRFQTELGSRYPANRNVQAKIRQQLQVLRDGGVLEFIGSGRYRMQG